MASPRPGARSPPRCAAAPPRARQHARAARADELAARRRPRAARRAPGATSSSTSTRPSRAAKRLGRGEARVRPRRRAALGLLARRSRALSRRGLPGCRVDAACLGRGRGRARRRVDWPSDTMSRLYVVEPRLSVTGMAADERLARPGAAGRRGRRRHHRGARRARRESRSGGGAPRRGSATGRSRTHAWVAGGRPRSRRAHAGASLVVAGDAQPPDVHALAHAMNELLGNVGRTVTYGPSPVFEAGERQSTDSAACCSALDAGEVDTLIIVGGDPAYTAPADLELARRLRSARVDRVRRRAPQRSTAGACAWSCAGSALPRGVGRCARVRRDAVDRPAAHRARWSRARPSVRSRGAPRAGATHARAIWSSSYWRAHAATRRLRRHLAAARSCAASCRRARARPRSTCGSTGAPSPARSSTPRLRRRRSRSSTSPTRRCTTAASATTPGCRSSPDPVTKLTWDNAALVSPATAASDWTSRTRTSSSSR